MAKKLSDSMIYALTNDAINVKKVRESAKKIKKEYLPEVASKKIKTEIEGLRKSRNQFKEMVENESEKCLHAVKEAHENRFTDNEHQLAVSNILKMLEIRNYDVSDKQFENLIAPLVKKNDYFTLDILGDIMNTKNKILLGNYCKENSAQGEVEANEKMMDAINQYINTDLYKSVGGEPTKYQYSSYEELCLLAENLGFDIDEMTTHASALNGNKQVICNPYDFAERQMAIVMQIDVEPPIFNFEKIEQENAIKMMDREEINSSTDIDATEK